MVSAMNGRRTKAEVDAVLSQLGYDETARAEELSVDKIQELAESLRIAELSSEAE